MALAADTLFVAGRGRRIWQLDAQDSDELLLTGLNSRESSYYRVLTTRSKNLRRIRRLADNRLVTDPTVGHQGTLWNPLR